LRPWGRRNATCLSELSKRVELLSDTREDWAERMGEKRISGNCYKKTPPLAVMPRNSRTAKRAERLSPIVTSRTAEHPPSNCEPSAAPMAEQPPVAGPRGGTGARALARARRLAEAAGLTTPTPPPAVPAVIESPLAEDALRAVPPTIVHNNILCTCRREENLEEHGPMILCASEGCPIRWYHMQCVGLTGDPDEYRKVVWVCPLCCFAVTAYHNARNDIPMQLHGIEDPGALRFNLPQLIQVTENHSAWYREFAPNWTADFRHWYLNIGGRNALRLRCPKPIVHRRQFQPEKDVVPLEDLRMPNYTQITGDAFVVDEDDEPLLFVIRTGAIALDDQIKEYLTAAYESVYYQEPTLFDAPETRKNARDTKTGIIYHGGVWITLGSRSQLPVMPRESAYSFWVWDNIRAAGQSSGAYRKMSTIKDCIQGREWRQRIAQIPPSLRRCALSTDQPGHLVTLNFNALSGDHYDIRNYLWGGMMVHGTWPEDGGGRLVFHDQELIVNLRPGDIIFNRFEMMRHSVEPLKDPMAGNRYSEVHVEHWDLVRSQTNRAALWQKMRDRALVGGPGTIPDFVARCRQNPPAAMAAATALHPTEEELEGGDEEEAILGRPRHRMRRRSEASLAEDLGQAESPETIAARRILRPRLAGRAANIPRALGEAISRALGSPSPPPQAGPSGTPRAPRQPQPPPPGSSRGSTPGSPSTRGSSAGPPA
jgi:hypothetical protein